MARKSVNYLENRAILIANAGVTQALTANNSTVLAFPTIVEDNFGLAKNESGLKYKVPKTTIYDVEAQIGLTAHELVAGKKYELSVYVNGVKETVIAKFQSQSETDSYEVFLKGSAALRLTKDDEISFVFTTDSAVALEKANVAMLNKVQIIEKTVRV